MPYIPQSERKLLNASLEELMHQLSLFEDSKQDGALNYCVSRLVAGVLKPASGWRYWKIARGIAVFICAALEFYRRVAAPYEDKAINNNGDIYEYET